MPLQVIYNSEQSKIANVYLKFQIIGGMSEEELINTLRHLKMQERNQFIAKMDVWVYMRKRKYLCSTEFTKVRICFLSTTLTK